MIQSSINHNTFNFPVGEMQVTVDPEYMGPVDIEFIFEKNADIIELLMFCDAVQRAGCKLGELVMRYVPFSRQDRCNNKGEAFSLKVFCDLINGLNFRVVYISDPHSDVTPALLKNCVTISQCDLLAQLINRHVHAPFYLVAPDAGALKKTHTLAKELYSPMFLGIIETSKLRNTQTGEITGTVVHTPMLPTYTAVAGVVTTYVMVDDIIDGGRTFIELAKELRKKGAQQVYLFATHGFFTKGKEVFDGYIDLVRVANDYSERFK